MHQVVAVQSSTEQYSEASTAETKVLDKINGSGRMGTVAARKASES